MSNARLIREGYGNDSFVVKKFGFADVGTSYTPLCRGGVYRTPQPAAAVALRIKAGDTNDTAEGSGAQAVTLEGLDQDGYLVRETLATAGTSASSYSNTTFLRLFRAWVSASGTYATQSAGSHAANVVIQSSSEDWATIEFTGFPRSQTEIGVYTVPKNYVAYITSIHLYVDSSKVCDMLLFQRQGITDTAAPYSAMRIVMEKVGVTASTDYEPSHPYGPFPGLTDIGFMGKVSANTAGISVSFDVILVGNY